MRRDLAVAAALVVSCACPASAGTRGGAAVFLRQGVGARWLGLGGAARAAVRDVHAGYWNPAGLTGQGPAAWQGGSMVSFADLGRTTASLSASHLTDRHGAFGVSWIRQSVSDLERVDETGTVRGRESSAEDALLLSYGRALTYRLRAGTTVKLLHQELLGLRSSGIGWDVGLLVQPRLDREIFVAATAENLASAVAWETGARQAASRAFGAAAAYRFWRQRALVSVDAVRRDGPSGYSVHVGGEVWPVAELAVRSGVDDGLLTGGVSYRFAPYELDYAMTWDWDDRRLGNRHQVSLLVRF